MFGSAHYGAAQASSPLLLGFFWAVVSDEIRQAIEFFPTRRQAETMVAEALQDEPDWAGILRVEKVEFRTGTAN